MGISSKSI